MTDIYEAYTQLKNMFPNDWDNAWKQINIIFQRAEKADKLVKTLCSIKKEAISVEDMKAPARSLGSILFTINEALAEWEK